ncbi:MAG: AAC(3) family N-acetyltransferase [Campylobacterota bacterium]|nr:AAC(3) family N-acetyltransferase [Campylobacterota bacterium]
MINNFMDKLNIEKGSVLLLTENSLTLLMTMKKIDKIFSFNAFIDKLIEKLGKEGTLLIQTFDWRFCNGKKFDILKSKSQTSFLGNTALKRDDFIRTQHPIYSFAVTGKYKDELASLNNIGAFDKDSPFFYIYTKKAKMMIIDIPLQNSFTFVHHVEDIEQVNYRYNKSFTSKYIDGKGIENNKTYDMYVRDIKNNVLTYFQPLEELLIENNAMDIYTVEELVIRDIDLHKAYHIIEDDIRNNNAKSLYKIGES